MLEVPQLDLQPSRVFLLKKRVLVSREFQEPRGDNVRWIGGDRSLQPHSASTFRMTA